MALLLHNNRSKKSLPNHLPDISNAGGCFLGNYIILPRKSSRESMKTLVNITVALLTIAAAGCQNSGNTNTDADTARVTIKSIPGFPGLVDSLPMVDRTDADEKLKDISGSSFIPAPNGHKFEKVLAGIFVRNNHYVAIVFKCYTNVNKNWFRQILGTFDHKGKMIATEEIGMNAVSESKTEHSYTRMEPFFENDSIIELRTQWYVYSTNHESEPKSKGKLKLIKLDAKGEISHLPQENISFQEYLHRFPEAKVPLVLDKVPDNSKLKPVSILTPFFNFEQHIFADTLQFYHYGKIMLPGKMPMLLYSTDEMEQGEGVIAPGYTLVVYTPEGKETDRKMLLGREDAEGYYTQAENATIAADGTIHMKETLAEPIFYNMDQQDDWRFIWDLTLRQDADGELMETRNSLEIASRFFDAKSMRTLLSSILPDESREEHSFEGTSWIPFPHPVAIAVHIFHRNSERLAEVVLANQNLDITDRYVIFSNLKNTSYAGTMPTHLTFEEDGEHQPKGERNFIGTATLKINDKILTITQNGKFTGK